MNKKSLIENPTSFRSRFTCCGKKGLSAIVATVLVIMITIAGVAIIWGVVIPTIKQGATFDDVNTRLDIVKSGGYTFYDESVDKLYIQVKRGSDQNDMVGMDILVRINGNSQTYSYNSSYVPGPNQMKTIVIGGIESLPETIRVLPVVSDNGITKRSSTVSESVVEISSEREPMPVSGFECQNAGDVFYNVSCCTPLVCPSVNNSVCVGTNITFNRGCGLTCQVPGSMTPLPCPTSNSSVCVGTNVTFNRSCGLTCQVPGSMTGTCIAASTRQCGSVISQPACAIGCATVGTNCSTAITGLTCNTGLGRCQGSCYQESANVATACGGLATGSYSCTGVGTNCSILTDRDWNNLNGGLATLYINYTKPQNATNNSVWKTAVLDGGSGVVVNVSSAIPINCWNQNVPSLHLRVVSNYAGGYYFGTSNACWNGTHWALVSSAHWSLAIEEAMNWTIA